MYYQQKNGGFLLGHYMRQFSKKEIDIKAELLAERYITTCSAKNAIKILNKAWHKAIKIKKIQDSACK